MPIGSDIIAVILGASEWPKYPNLEGSLSFRYSANYMRDYLISTPGLAIPKLNILDLFDSELEPGPLISGIKEFIADRLNQNTNISDIIFFYVGHGGYLDERTYFLGLRCTSSDAKNATGFKTSYLRDIILDKTLEKRNIVILDACFSGAAMTDFAVMSNDDLTLIKQEVEDDSPAKGTVLFCAAGATKWAKAPVDDKLTMFSGALLQVLEHGDRDRDQQLSIKDVAELVNREVHRRFGSEGVRPYIHVPLQDVRDIVAEPYFPNAALSATTKLDDRLDKLTYSVSSLSEKVDFYIESSTKAGSPTEPMLKLPPRIMNVIESNKEIPGRYKELAAAALQECYGQQSEHHEKLIKFVFENMLDKVCEPGSALGLHQVSDVVLSESKIEGHFHWEELKQYTLYCPTASGSRPHLIQTNSIYFVTPNKVLEALQQSEFRIKVGNKIVFEFSRWWSSQRIEEIKAGFDWAEDDARVCYDGNALKIEIKREVKISKVECRISVFEESFLSKEDRSYSLAMSRPTLGLDFSMQLKADGWVLKPPMISPRQYHLRARDLAEIEQPHEQRVSARVPGWVLPGIALAVEWGPGGTR